MKTNPAEQSICWRAVFGLLNSKRRSKSTTYRSEITENYHYYRVAKLNVNAKAFLNLNTRDLCLLLRRRPNLYHRRPPFWLILSEVPVFWAGLGPKSLAYRPEMSFPRHFPVFSRHNASLNQKEFSRKYKNAKIFYTLKECTDVLRRNTPRGTKLSQEFNFADRRFLYFTAPNGNIHFFKFLFATLL